MSALEKEIISWFEINKRDLPWRSATPWGVMVSEFMLQQTSVVRVLPKWNEWMQRWPSPHDLSIAPTADVITAWGRLGYPRRALRLHEASKVIVRDFNGVIPSTQEELRSLPGVGEYTAAAIASFAFNQQALVLDINIRRLFARVIDGVEFPTPAPTTKERNARQGLIPIKDAHIWAAGTMELGALICTSRRPKCELCPVKSHCSWSKKNYPKSEQVRKGQGWHGTDRKCRGIIIQALRENSFLNENQLKALWKEDSQVEKALVTLVKDGLIEKNMKAYSLPST